MNPLIETLNRCGENALHFAWPMLWQSSVLIAVLFAADFALRRHVRAAVRYALWLVVLVKLLLPPSLALADQRCLVAVPALPAHGQSTNDPFYRQLWHGCRPRLPPLHRRPSLRLPPPPAMSAAAWMLLAWSAIGVGLLAWLTVRWRQVIARCAARDPGPALAERIVR